MTSLLLLCRAHKIDKALLVQQIPFFETLLDLRDPELRNAFLKYFVAMLIVGPQGKKYKSRAMQLASLLLSSLGDNVAQESAIGFIKKVEDLLNQKDFKDELRIKSLMHNLLILVETPLLNSAEKMTIMNTLIFVKDSQLTGKKQTEQLLTSAQIVAQFIGFGRCDVLESIVDPNDLSKKMQDMFSEALQISMQDFVPSYLATIGKWRKRESLLTFANTLNKLSKEDKDKLLESKKEERKTKRQELLDELL